MRHPRVLLLLLVVTLVTLIAAAEPGVTSPGVSRPPPDADERVTRNDLPPDFLTKPPEGEEYEDGYDEEDEGGGPVMQAANAAASSSSLAPVSGTAIASVTLALASLLLLAVAIGVTFFPRSQGDLRTASAGSYTTAPAVTAKRSRSGGERGVARRRSSPAAPAAAAAPTHSG